MSENASITPDCPLDLEAVRRLLGERFDLLCALHDYDGQHDWAGPKHNPDCVRRDDFDHDDYVCSASCPVVAEQAMGVRLGEIEEILEGIAIRKGATPWTENTAQCDHGVTFDEDEAKRILRAGKLRHPNGTAPAVAFILGDPNTEAIRQRFPRLHGKCPKGCGFEGIAYASRDHYLYGDW